ncbi:hypothetical protein Henu3_gp80 [Mycobacterium phage Henu3 PeY-2017]|nr:hypothetical protein Henu3_gp80 [Mycobacterium phage Henu3 PeY-2017]
MRLRISRADLPAPLVRGPFRHLNRITVSAGAHGRIVLPRGNNLVHELVDALIHLRQFVEIVQPHTELRQRVLPRWTVSHDSSHLPKFCHQTRRPTVKTHVPVTNRNHIEHI